MKILCLVKSVPASTVDAGFRADLTLDRDTVEGQLSELDEYAVEQAVRLAEAGLAQQVTHVTMGPSAASAGLHKALAIGGDDAVHILDDALHGSDARTTALVLAAAAERCGFDLVLCGMGSTDAEMSVVPSMVAELLGLPELAFVSELSLEAGTVRATRRTDRAIEQVAVALPALVSVTDQIGEARYPTFRNIVAARKKPVQVWTLADLGLDPALAGLAGAATAVREMSARPPRAAGTVIADSDAAAAALADFLADRKLLPHP